MDVVNWASSPRSGQEVQHAIAERRAVSSPFAAWPKYATCRATGIDGILNSVDRGAEKVDPQSELSSEVKSRQRICCVNDRRDAAGAECGGPHVWVNLLCCIRNRHFPQNCTDQKAHKD